MRLDIQSMMTYGLALLVAVVGWIATNLIGKPYLAYRALRAEIASCLILYANIPCPPHPEAILPPRTVEARDKYRGFASQLIAIANSVAFYRVWSSLGILPKWNDLEEAKGNLIGLSNSIGEPNQGLEISRRMDNIRRLLRIK